MVLTEEHKSRLFEFLAELGLLYSTQGIVNNIRKEHPLYEILPLSYDDVKHISYFGPHFLLTKRKLECCEIWINDHYVNPKSVITVEKNPFQTYCILNEEYDIEKSILRCYHNDNIIYRHTIWNEDADTPGNFAYTIDLTKEPYSELDDIEKSCYYISNSGIHVPNFEYIHDGTQVMITATYHKDFDFFICSNLVNILEVRANVGTYIDHPTSKKCYYNYIIDHDDTYPINCSYYPCIQIDKDCVLRIFNDNYNSVEYPYTNRLINYPEFMNVDDPYNSDNEFLQTYVPSKEIITSEDTDDQIYEKFHQLAKGFFRMWEIVPYSSLEESDFIICDNTSTKDISFVNKDILSESGISNHIISTIPHESSRDILFYNGVIFDDYTIENIHTVNGVTEFYENGIPTYIIPAEYDADKFTLVKFNSAEDATIMNVGEYIDVDNYLKLHHKLNRFYRNLMFLRMSVMDIDNDEVYVSNNQPDNPKDDALWFEILTGLDVDSMLLDYIDKITISKSDIPEDIKRACYRIDMEPGNGPASYTEVLMTYLKLSEKQKEYLALQYGDDSSAVDDVIYKDLQPVNDPSEIESPDLSDLILDDMDDDLTELDKTGQMILDDLVSGIEDEIDSIGNMDDIDDITDPTVGKYGLDVIAYSDSEGNTVHSDEIDNMSRDEKITFIKNYMSDDFSDKYSEQLEKTKTSTLNDIVSRIKLARDDYVKDIILNELDMDDSEILTQIAEDIILKVLIECGTVLPEELPEDKLAALVFDFGEYNEHAKDKGTFDEKLHKIIESVERPDINTLQNNDVWYEFLEDTANHVCYSDSNTMVINIDNHFYGLQFENDNVEMFMFDDILMNFTKNKGIKYTSILADLINSNVLSYEDCNIFYGRLITDSDIFDPELRRLYTGTSNVVTMLDGDDKDYIVTYSSNIGRFRMDYKTVSNKVRESAYRMEIDYSERDDFAFLHRRMLLFVNGKYIPQNQYREDFAYKIKLLDFHEIISTVDILYSKRDLHVMKLKRMAYEYWLTKDDTPVIQNPDDYDIMEPIHITDKTYAGYYDVLMNEYILNGKLVDILSNLKTPNEIESFKKDFIFKFADITDVRLSNNGIVPDTKIVIPCMSYKKYKYSIDT